MKTTTLMALAFFAMLPSTQAATITLAEFGFNLDGTVTSGAAPAGVNISGFNTGTGLGTIVVTQGGAGSHYLSLFVDHDIDETVNTFFNELGSQSGLLATGQSWEIDEPGFGLPPAYVGDIYTNFSAGSLDGTLFNSSTPGPQDVSMALGWGFMLESWETGTASFTISENMPTGGFFLKHSDPDSDAAIYLSSSLRVTGSPSGVPDGGSTLVLLLCAIGGLASCRSGHGLLKKLHANH